VDAVVKGSFDYNDRENPPGRVTLTMCPQCQSAILAVQEDFGGGLDAPERIYPTDDFRLGYQVPKPLRDAFAEAQLSFKAKAFTAAAIMCRKPLEGLCVDKGLTTGTLAARLKTLRDAKVIESRLYEWAEQLRLSGNDAAHDIGVVFLADDARDVMEFTQALLEYVFTFQSRFESFKVRRANSKAAAP
jgi:hypothetical protein